MRFAVALALLITGLLEFANTAIEEFLHVELGTKHGLLVYSFSQLGRVLHSLFEDVQAASEVVIAAELSAVTPPRD